jgi:diguanylate cyclase (GGDEF)-like protein/PAS domain S-box-containing protein
MCEITGYSREQLEATTHRSITHPDDLARNERGYQEIVAGQASHYRTEMRYIHSDGHVVPVDLSATVVRDGDGEPVHVLTQVQDITERKRFEGQLQYLADHDSLTGLFNRRRFEEELERHVVHGRRYGMSGALLLLDLDDFKQVNDSFGHRAGDSVLTAVAEVLRGRLRESDIVARFGGDEFAVLMPVGGVNEAAELANLVADAICSDVPSPAGPLYASIGIALFDEATTPDEILSEADDAMYADKRASRHPVRHLRSVE